MIEIGYFDNYIWKDNINYTITEDHNQVNFRGSWSVFPYFKPNRNTKEYHDVIVSQNINTGLYVLRHDIGLNDIFIIDEDDDDDSFWTQDIIITFSTVGAMVLLLICAIVVIYLYKVSARNKNGDEAALIDNTIRNNNDNMNDNQMTAMGESDNITR